MGLGELLFLDLHLLLLNLTLLYLAIVAVECSIIRPFGCVSSFKYLKSNGPRVTDRMPVESNVCKSISDSGLPSLLQISVYFNFAPYRAIPCNATRAVST